MSETLVLVGLLAAWILGEFALVRFLRTPGRYLAITRVAVVAAVGIGVWGVVRH